MTQQQGEQISALLDGELGGRQHDRVVSDLVGENTEGLARFGRYRLIGEVMRGEDPVVARDIVAAVGEVLRDEPTVLAPVRRRAWLKPAAGAAIAASVAALAIVVAPGLLPGGDPAGIDAARPVVASAPVVAPAAPVALGTGGLVADNAQGGDDPARWQALNDETADRLNRLVIEHHEFSGRTGVNGPVAHIGLVSYERR